MHGYYVKKIGKHRGRPRLWLQGGEVGMEPGTRFDVHLKSGSIVLRANPDGSRVVSRKKRGDSHLPVIDINSAELLALFEGMDAIRMMQKDGEIYLSPLATELKKKERLTRLKGKLLSGAPLAMGSLSHGGGILSHAIHEGIQKSGLESRLAFANEIRPELIDHARTHNEIWDSRTLPLAAPLQEVAFDPSVVNQIPTVEILEAGLPCSGASVAGRAKRQTSHPEQHPEVGHLVVGALVILAKVNPAVFVLENVVPYSQSASASILRNQLRDLGYQVHETVLAGAAFGDVENRERWCMVAATEGLKFDWSMLEIPDAPRMTLSDGLDDIPDDSPMWSEMTGLKKKQARDIADGKGFRMQIYDADATEVGTMTKGYAKVRSTDPKLQHPTNPDLLRQFTPAESAKFKQIPPHLIDDLSATIAHEVLGQSVSHSAFTATGKLVGDTLRTFAQGEIDTTKGLSELVEQITQELSDSAGHVVAELRRAVRGAIYEGPITVCDLGMVVQDIGNGVGIAHKLTDLGDSPLLTLGDVARISYPRLSSDAVVDIQANASEPAAQPSDEDDLDFDFDTQPAKGLSL